MSDELDRAVDARIDAYRPVAVPPFAAVRARKRRRDASRSGAVVLGAVAVAALAFLSSSVAGTSGSVAGEVAGEGPTARPPEVVDVAGVEFFRGTTQPFLLRPAVKPDDALGIFVTVPQTQVRDGECAVHYEPVIASQHPDAVTLATWRYTPRQTQPTLSCAGVGYGDRTVRLQLEEPLDDRPLRIDGREGPSQVLLLSPDPGGGPVMSNLAPSDPDSAEICLEERCVTVTDDQLIQMSADAINSALRVRPGDDCSDQGRTDNVERTYLVRFLTAGRAGPQIEVPLGCTPLRVVGGDQEFGLSSGAADVVRIAYDQQISPENQCLGIGGPSGGPETKDYVGLTLEQAEQRAAATKNDVIRIAGQEGVCVGIVRDHVINRVNLYLENGIVTAAHSF